MGAVRLTQGKTLAVMQVYGGSQFFSVVNQHRVLGWLMRMFTIPNQSSVPKAYLEFDEHDRMKPSSLRFYVDAETGEILNPTEAMMKRAPRQDLRDLRGSGRRPIRRPRSILAYGSALTNCCRRRMSPSAGCRLTTEP